VDREWYWKSHLALQLADIHPSSGSRARKGGSGEERRFSPFWDASGGRGVKASSGTRDGIHRKRNAERSHFTWPMRDDGTPTHLRSSRTERKKKQRLTPGPRPGEWAGGAGHHPHHTTVQHKADLHILIYAGVMPSANLC